jgi:hypothetical protein
MFIIANNFAKKKLCNANLSNPAYVFASRCYTDARVKMTMYINLVSSHQALFQPLFWTQRQMQTQVTIAHIACTAF